MRRHIKLTLVIIAAVALLIPLTASAQIWNLNLYGGWSYSTLSGGQTALSNGQYKSGFGGGVGAELRLNEDWGWEFGLWYIQKGTKGTFTSSADDPVVLPEPGETFTGNLDLDYVEIPILVNVYFPVGDKASVRGYIGPTFSFLTSAKADGTLDGETVENDVMDHFDDADITVMIGAGGQWELSRVNLMLDFRWDIGTTNIAKVEGAELRNSTVLITAGVGIPLQRGGEE
jgi:hypothetical protein